MKKFIGIEGGGTKFICGYGTGPDDLEGRRNIPTGSPSATMRALFEYIHEIKQTTEIVGIGASIFGPLDLNRDSKTYGYVTTTPKKEWINFDFVGHLKKEFNLPIGFDTDVNAAVMSEYRWGAAKNLSDCMYLTVGTGIGGGLIVNHQLVHGAMHPEMGHIFIPQDKNDHFPGVCQYHHHCLEGLASGPAIKERWQVKSALDLPPDHPGWDLEANYLGVAMANYTMTFSPKRIIVGGGVMRQDHLLPKVRQAMIKYLNGYIRNQTVIEALDTYIVKPGLEENAGVLGAIALAELATKEMK